MNFYANKPIAIIDSGIGGVSVLRQLLKKFGGGNYIYYADNLNMPYGNKNKEFIKNRVEYLIKLLKEKYNAELVIIACNTASTSIEEKNFSNVITMQFNKSNLYFATNLTKRNLKHLNVIADDNLPTLIENNIFSKNLSNIIKEKIKEHNLDQFSEVVLGCTHYELVLDLFKNFAPKTNFICNSSSIINKINIHNETEFTIQLLTSKKDKSFEDKFYELLN